MAQEIQSWRPPTGSSLEQKVATSREVLISSTSPRAGLEAAKRLIGCYPHARPPDPEMYIGALASVLVQYPLGLVDECCDPRRGLAREREFPPTVACVVDWCENRLKYHQALANFQGMPAKRIEVDYSPEHRATMLQRLSKLMHDTFDPKSAQVTE